MRQYWKNIQRDSVIGILFLLFIFILPLVTLCGGTSMEERVKENAAEVLNNNGTMQKNDGILETTTEKITEGDAFSNIQKRITDFTQDLFLRSAFIEGNTALTSFLTGGTYMESTQVLLGKENWLFYKTQNDGFPIYDYMGINHFSEEEMKAMADNLIVTRDYLQKEKNVDFVAVTIPNKEIVYEEYMPDTIARVDRCSKGQQFAEYMSEHTDVPYVYPLEAFSEQKGQYPLFYKTDTHWNHIGAFVGLQEILKTMYGYGQLPEEVVFADGQHDFAGDLSVIAGVADQYAIDTVYAFDPQSVNPDYKRDEIAIVVGDSFGGFLSVTARGYYKEVYWIDTDDFTVSMVDEYDADIVIWETVERLQETYMQDSLLD